VSVRVTPADGVPTPEAPAGSVDPGHQGVEPSGPFAGRAGRIVLALTIVAVAAGLVLRFVTTSDLWLDEALTVNIARRPLGDLVKLLRHDGAPPLYYVLLHLWMRVFGGSDVATRALSGVIGVVAVALCWPAAAGLGGSDPARRRWLGTTAVLVMATSAYAIRYSNEARMYMLEMALVLAGYLAMRAVLARPTLGRLIGLGVVTAALLYTQYWALYLVAVTGAGLVGAVVVARRQAKPATAPSRALAAVAIGCLAFVPWVPTFVYQTTHTGTPWSRPSFPASALDTALNGFAGGEHADAVVVELGFGVLVLLALFGVARSRWRVDLDLRTRPGARWEWFAWAATLALGMTVSFAAGSAFQDRYAAIVFPLFVVCVAYGIGTLGARSLRYGLLVVIVGSSLVGALRQVGEHRTQGGEIVAAVDESAEPGDVLAFCPDQLGPSGTRHLRADVEVGVFPGFRRADIVDWVDYEQRNTAADPEAFARDLLTRAGPDHAIYFAYQPGYLTFGTSCERIAAELARARPDATALVAGDEEIFEPTALVRYGP